MTKPKRHLDDIRIDYSNSFVQEGHHEVTPKKRRKCEIISQFTGNEIKQFYDDVINQKPSYQNCSQRKYTKKDHSSSKLQARKKLGNKTVHKLQKEFLRYASTGDKNQIEFIINEYRIDENFHDKILNYCDAYGWNALMCAAAEGYHDIIDLLMNERINIEWDLIENICRKRSQFSIFQYILSKEESLRAETLCAEKYSFLSVKKEFVVCDICGETYEESQKQQHESTTVHIFKDSSSVRTRYGIAESNKGFQMMLRSGWQADKGLGPDGIGRKHPVKTILKKNRSGFGLEKKELKKVTHFSAHDDRAVRVQSPRPKSVKIKFASKKVNEKKRRKDKVWEQNIRHYMSSDS